MRPLLLDLFCKAGGAGMGYYRAGFDVMGVDIEPQPRYPFMFVQADAMTFPLDGFDAIHASPPCQAYSALRTAWNARGGHPELVGPIRDRLMAAGVPWVIENVPGSPVRPDVMLCGSAFGLGIPGYQLRRHRLFEMSGSLVLSPACAHQGPAIGVYGDHGRDRRIRDGSCRYFTVGERGQALGIDWMTGRELSQAIPPAYTEHIGRGMLRECLPAIPYLAA